ncbi:MFS transporter [Gordonia amicalis]|uniref:MFS transporter n=1 Tax=Gordonia amicalis TaxID=89053 RepID=A0AAE4U1S9_9ACTN|nr:MFS transporter [Gordonia amicalis]MDV6314299.1 MFS transporter [Gordonia amicalis]
MTASPRSIAPLYLAGFTTAFGAHGVATVLGSESDDIGLSLLGLGLVLALYDLAEVVLKPLFGALSDRIGAKPVILGGLVAFAVASLIGVATATPLALALARFGQGAAASAFSPASSAAVARLAGRERLGHYFGRYGAWKSLGYVFGPLLGVGLVYLGGIRSLYAALAVLGLAAAIWVAVALPAPPVLPRQRYTLADLARQTTERGFLVPTMLLATTTAILGVAVGFLPLLASREGLPSFVGAASVAVLALVSTVVQPLVGRYRDEGRLTIRTGALAGMTVGAAALILVAFVPHAVTLLIASAAIGVMVGSVTPLAFAHLADSTPDERMGRTMGNAELGREVGDAGGPLMVGAIATFATLPIALLALAVVALGVGATGRQALRPVGEAT